MNLVADLNANPVPLTLENPATGEDTDVLLTGDLFVTTLTNLFAAVDYLPKAIYETLNGNYKFIRGVLPGAFAGDTGVSTADGLYESVFCAEVSHLTIGDLATEDAYPEIVQAMTPFIQLNLDICSMWDVESVPPGHMVVSDVPALIMEGAYDTNKPPELGAEVARNFGTSYLVEFGDKAHVTLSGCGIAMMAAFMNDPAHAPDTGCVSDAPSFVPPAGPLWRMAIDNLPLAILGVIVVGGVVWGIAWLIRCRKARRKE